MKWARPWLTVTLLVSLICLTSCAARVRYIYRTSEEQIFLVPAGTELVAGEQPIVTDGADGKVELSNVRLSYDGVLMAEGTFLKLYKERVADNGVDNGG